MVISMEMMGKIRRMYFRDKLSLHQIAKRTGLSRNTIRKWVRAPEATQPAYSGAQPSANSVRSCNRKLVFQCSLAEQLCPMGHRSTSSPWGVGGIQPMQALIGVRACFSRRF